MTVGLRFFEMERLLSGSKPYIPAELEDMLLLVISELREAADGRGAAWRAEVERQLRVVRDDVTSLSNDVSDGAHQHPTEGDEALEARVAALEESTTTSLDHRIRASMVEGLRQENAEHLASMADMRRALTEAYQFRGQVERLVEERTVLREELAKALRFAAIVRSERCQSAEVAMERIYASLDAVYPSDDGGDG